MNIPTQGVQLWWLKVSANIKQAQDEKVFNMFSVFDIFDAFYSVHTSYTTQIKGTAYEKEVLGLSPFSCMKGS